MIDRKALWISILLIFAMIAANFWRLSLLPDWHYVPYPAEGGIRTVSGFWIFLNPLLISLFIALFWAVNWKFGPKRTSPDEAVRAWRQRQGLVLIFIVGMEALAHAFRMARSLGVLQSVDPQSFRHVLLVAAGIFMMVFGNTLPKMPWLTERFRPLDPWQWNQHIRFQGKIIFVYGLFMAVGIPFLPIKLAAPVVAGMSLAIIATSLWHRTKLKRASSPQP